MNNNYNPMNPVEDTRNNFQWSVHTVKRSSALFKCLNKENWSCAGIVNKTVDSLFQNENALCFYWRKPIVKFNFNNIKQNNTFSNINPFSPPNLTNFKVSSPIFKFSGNCNTPTSNCSTPAREVEENIVGEDNYIDENFENDNIDTFFDSFNNNNK